MGFCSLLPLGNFVLAPFHFLYYLVKLICYWPKEGRNKLEDLENLGWEITEFCPLIPHIIYQKSLISRIASIKKEINKLDLNLPRNLCATCA